LKGSFTKSAGRRKLELEKEIKEMKYNTNEDINILLANLQNLINDLEEDDGDISTTSEIGILNRCLPLDLRWVNVFQFNEWNKCVNYIKKVFPEISLSNLKETNNNTSQNNNLAFSVDKYHKVNQIDKNQSKKHKFHKKQRKKEKRNYCKNRTLFLRV